MLEERICEVCGKLFKPITYNQKICRSKECLTERSKQYWKFYSEERPTTSKKCVQCGKTFKTHRGNQKLCSVQCRNQWNQVHSKDHYGAVGGRVDNIYFDPRTQTKYYIKGVRVIAEDQSGIKIVEKCASETAANRSLNRLAYQLGSLPLLCEIINQR